MNDAPRFAYPRPQLERPQWMCLNGPWRFVFDDERRYSHPSDIAAWPLSIEVPFPPESRGSGIGDRAFHFTCWYERDFDVSAEGRRVLLHFGAVDYYARVWVNGRLVATHEGGHTPFWADITSALRHASPQVVTVMAYDDPLELTKPRGKQDWQLNPHGVWYPRTTGIWQTVWLEKGCSNFINNPRSTQRHDAR